MFITQSSMLDFHFRKVEWNNIIDLNFAAFEQEVETKSFINPTQLSTVLTKQ